MMRDLLAYFFSDVTPGGVISGLIGTAIAVAIGLIYNRWIRKPLADLAASNRQYARREVLKRVRSDEYHSERQKTELVGLVIGMGGFVCATLLAIPFGPENPDAIVLSLFMLLLSFTGGLLFFLEDRYNTAALKVRMRREQRKRMQWLRQRRRVPDAN